MTPIVVGGSTGCTLSSLRTELQARGSADLADGRATDFLNAAYRALLNTAPWPFLETTTSGTAPLTITDMRQVLHVRDSTTDTPLEGVDIRTLHDGNPDLDQTGTPSCWWLDGLTTLRVWPLNTTDTISVRYLRRANNLVADADTTIFPSDWCYLVILGAQLFVLSENVDNPELAEASQRRYDQGVAEMLDTYMGRNYQNPQYILASEAW